MPNKNDPYRNSSAYTFFNESQHESGVTVYRYTVILLLCFIALLGILFLKKTNGEIQSGQATVKGLTAEITPAPKPEKTESNYKTSEEQTPVSEEASGVPEDERDLRSLTWGDIINPIPDIFERVSPGVVGILNYQELPDKEESILVVYASGTGFIVTDEGYVLTNAHVVEDAAAVSVQLANGRKIDAQILGTDKETDIAVLKIDGMDLQPLICGDSTAVRIGEFCLAIGNPLDSERLANTITFGIISATDREINIDSFTNTYLQTDAAINFGNSGGPLLNMNGEVIGMNSAKSITAGYDSYGNPVAAEGIGFALPINDVLEIAEKLVQEGSVKRPGVGVTVSTVTEIMIKGDGLPAGAMVESVVPGSPADEAEMKAGDIITHVNGIEIYTHEEVVQAVKECSIGDSIELTVYRDGDILTIIVVLANKTEMDFDAAEETVEAEAVPETEAMPAP